MHNLAEVGSFKEVGGNEKTDVEEVEEMGLFLLSGRGILLKFRLVEVIEFSLKECSMADGEGVLVPVEHGGVN